MSLEQLAAGAACAAELADEIDAIHRATTSNADKSMNSSNGVRVQVSATIYIYAVLYEQQLLPSACSVTLQVCSNVFITVGI
jgi:hypothetical protein